MNHCAHAVHRANHCTDYSCYTLSQAYKIGPKGHLISKCPFGVFKSPKKPPPIFERISALALKKRSNQKSRVRESK